MIGEESKHAEEILRSIVVNQGIVRAITTSESIISSTERHEAYQTEG